MVIKEQTESRLCEFELHVFKAYLKFSIKLIINLVVNYWDIKNGSIISEMVSSDWLAKDQLGSGLLTCRP